MKNAKKILLILLMIPFVVLPIYSDYIIGVFSWHISVSVFWRDALELIIYLTIVFSLGTFFKESRSGIILIVGGSYLLSIGTLLQVIVAYLFVEGIILVGRIFSIKIFKNEYSDAIDFVIGSMVLGLIDIVLSLMKLGTINDLRIAFIVTVIVFFIIGRGNLSINNLLIIKWDRYVKKISRTQFLMLIPLVACILIAFARVNIHLESDSLWYALYTDKNLFGENSFYDFLGYTGFIYYYPKFKELLMAPLSGLRTAGYLIAPNIWIMVLMLKETYDFIKEKIEGIREEAVILIISLIYTTMAIVGTAGTAKSDTIGYLFILICWVAFERFLQGHDYRLLWISISSGIMSYSVKYTHYVWTTILLIGFFCYYFVLVTRKKIPKISCIKSGIILLFMSIFVLVGVLGRTIKITGFPFGRVGIGILKKLGFSGTSLFNYSETSDLPSVFLPIRIWKSLFMVGQADKITAQWIGNYIFFFLLAVLLIIPMKKLFDYFKKAIWKGILILVLNIVSMYFLVTMHAPDGNYFEFTIIITALEMASIICISKDVSVFYKKLLFVCGWIFCVLNLVLNFTVDPSWGCATRFSYDPIKTVKTQEENMQYMSSILKMYGIDNINDYLKENESDSFIIVDSGNTFLMCLDARVEMATDLSNPYISAAYGTDFEGFVDYVNASGVKGFILSNDDTGDEMFERYAKEFLNTYGWLVDVEDDGFTYYKIR